MKKYSQYQLEQNKLLMDFLFEKNRNCNQIEFIISSYCNQACEYCYLYKHGKEMYPDEANNFNNIVENYKILIEWLEENNFVYADYDFFSGEFFNLPIWEDLLQITYDFELKRQEVKKTPRVVSIPTNASFLMDDIKTQKIRDWIYKFQEIGSNIYISFSVEGPEELERLERPLKNSQKKTNENFYQKFFQFRKEFELSAHPMVTRNFVKDYKTNYDWWIDTTIENKILQKNNAGQDIYSIPMFLEVRDAEQWDEESLKNYKNFLFYVAEKDLKTIHQNNLDDFAYHFFSDLVDEQHARGVYTKVQPYIISYPHLINNLPCSIQGGPVFRVGDLAYVACHRTCYPHFVFGHFIKEDNQIVGIEANKPTLAIKIKNLNPNRSVLKCSNCPINAFCIKGCLGSQYEHTNELFCADERVCDLFYTKFKTIHEIALKYDLYSWLNQNSNFSKEGKDFAIYARRIIEQL